MHGNDLNDVHNLEDKIAAMKFLTVATIVIGLISSAIAWDFIITRNSTNRLTTSVVESIDKFNITECSSRDNVCTKFGGQNLQDRCQCICSKGKSTFGFYNSEWGCTENSIVQKHAAGRKVYTVYCNNIQLY